VAELVTQLPRDARRVLVRGTSGSGKTTLARACAAALGVAHVELDGVFHQPGWTPLPDDEFVEAIAAVAATDDWVACGNYRQVSAPLLERCDTVVLYDLPRRTVMRRILWRTVRRVARHEELWNGNHERFANLCSLDPEVSVCAWAWTTHAARHADTLAFLADPPRADLRVLHVASTDDERVVYAGLRRTTAGAGAR
jgi:adenylate kinase family enzyme